MKTVSNANRAIAKLNLELLVISVLASQGLESVCAFEQEDYDENEETIERKMNMARQLLENIEKNIKKISNRLG